MKWQHVLACGVILFTLGCTQGAPTISPTEELPPIVLDDDNFEARTLELYDVLFTGRVSKLVHTLEVSLDNGSSWVSLDNTAQSSFKIDLATCSSHCQFSYEVSNVGQKWSRVMQIQPGEEVTGLVRGRSNFGFTTPAGFKLRRLQKGFFSVGSIGLNRVGAKSKTLTSGLKVLGGKLEAQPVSAVTLGSTGVVIHNQGVIQ